MTFTPDLRNPNEGNQILRAGAGKSYNIQSYLIPELNKFAEVTFDSGADAPRVVAELNGDFTLHGRLTLSGTGVVANDVLFSLPLVMISPAALVITGTPRQAMANVFSDSAVVTPLTVLVSPSSSEGGYADITWKNGALSDPDGIILDGLKISPLN